MTEVAVCVLFVALASQDRENEVCGSDRLRVYRHRSIESQ